MDSSPEFFRQIVKDFKVADALLSSQLKLHEDAASAKRADVLRISKEAEQSAIGYMQAIEKRDSASAVYPDIKIAPHIDADIATLKHLSASVRSHRDELNRINSQTEILKRDLQDALSMEQSARKRRYIRRVGLAVASVGVLIALHFSFLDRTLLSFTLSLDGKDLPSAISPTITMDNKPFVSGSKINLGRHQIAVTYPGGEPFATNVWVFYGKHDLGLLPLESSKGSLSVIVKPSPAEVIVQQENKIISQGAAPFKISKLATGNYDLTVHRGRYQESRSITIERQQLTETNIDLNLGSAQFLSEPPDANFSLSGNDRHWEGKLPIAVDDVPAGDYSLTVSRKGWDQTEGISISRGQITTNKTEFWYGAIEVTSDPTGLPIYTNEVEIGKTPLTLRELRPGQYTLTASDGENDLSGDVTVAPHEVAKHAFVFHYGTVQLSSVPPGATVIRKAKELGKTPLTLNHIPAGDMVVELRLQDYVTTNFEIHAVEGATTKLSAKLVSERFLQTMKEARETFDARQFDESKKLLDAALKYEPNNVIALELQTQVFKALVEAEEARKETERKSEIARKVTERNETIAIIEKAISAVGGREAINRFNSYKVISRASGVKKGSNFSLRTTVYIDLPDKMRLDQLVNNPPKGLTVFGLNVGDATVNEGKPVLSIFCITENAAWEVAPGLLGVPQTSVSQTVQSMLRRSLYAERCKMFISLLEPEYTLERVSASLSESSAPVAIKVHKAGKPEITLFFDKTSGLLVELDIEWADGHSHTVHESERYRDYRNHSGIMYPTITDLVEDGGISSTSTVESIVPLNQYSRDVFTKPRGQ